MLETRLELGLKILREYWEVVVHTFTQEVKAGRFL